MNAVGSYAYCRIMHGAYNVKLHNIIFICINTDKRIFATISLPGYQNSVAKMYGVVCE